MQSSNCTTNPELHAVDLKILIVKIGAIGDVVMALPLLKRIKKKHPHAHVTWLCGKVVVELLSQYKEIDLLIVVDENQLISQGVAGKIKAIISVWKHLLFKKFDLVLYFYFSDLYKILILPASWSSFKRFDKSGSKRLNPIPGRHHSSDYISTFEEPTGPFTFEASYPEFLYRNVDLERLRANDKDKKWVVLSCGGAKNILRDDDLRRWPIESYVALAKALADGEFKIILSGAPSDKWVEKHFEGIDFQSFIGILKLNDFVALLKVSNLLITHDSGPLHLADIAGCPVIGIFGPTIPQEKTSLQPKSTFIWGGENLSCRPCYDGKSYAHCQDNQCMKLTSHVEVLEKAKAILNQD